MSASDLDEFLALLLIHLIHLQLFNFCGGGVSCLKVDVMDAQRSSDSDTV